IAFGKHKRSLSVKPCLPGWQAGEVADDCGHFPHFSHIHFCYNQLNQPKAPETRVTQAIEIKWSMSEPPVPARAWVSLKGSPSTHEDIELETALGWPPGSLGFLRDAFTQGLS